MIVIEDSCFGGLATYDLNLWDVLAGTKRTTVCFISALQIRSMIGGRDPNSINSSRNAWPQPIGENNLG